MARSALPLITLSWQEVEVVALFWTRSLSELLEVVPIETFPELSTVALVTPPVFILTVSDAKFIPVLLSVPVNAGAEADPSTPEIPVVPLMFNAIIKE